ncbi:MAG TPA: lipid IV(A) 4-amino-4-deoxy-L-arabinosyltransferase [Pseudomonas sp.]|nr:lipid IV(A) 4-amino-4-deoxy-L-arabinosyltransferase [Pseudomonas sp.]
MSLPRATLLLVGAFVLFILLPLGGHGLWIPDETRYAQIAQAMLHSGDWVAPQLLGLRYFEKPVAGYWLIAAAQALFGENLFGVRLASALATAASTLLTALLARQLWQDPRKTGAAALLYLSFALVAGQAGYSNLDPQFTLWVNLSQVALWLALAAGSRNARLGLWALLGVACAMGFLTKGFLAWLLPVIVAVPYALWQKRWGELLRYGPLAIGVAILLALPWALAVHLREPDYWHFFFWHEHIRRFAGEDAQHNGAWWFFLPILFAGSLPWTLLVFPALRHGWQQRRDRRSGFLLLSLALPFLFFSLSRGKLPTYILPCFLPLALLMANALVEALAQGRLRLLRANGALNLTLGALLLLALAWLQLTRPAYHDEPLKLALVALVGLAWVACGALQLARPAQCWAAPALALWLLVALLPAALPRQLVNSKMPDQFVAAHLDELRGARHLLSNDLGAAFALAWRLQRTDVTLLNTEGELKYGLAQPEGTGRSLAPEQLAGWLAQARRDGPVGVLIRINSKNDAEELALLPAAATRYREGQLVILLVPQGGP